MIRLTTKTNYTTPESIRIKYKDYFDPCPLNPTFDGLKIEWHDFNFVNPPYVDKVLWIRKAIEEMKKGRTSVLLLPVDTSTEWFHDLILGHAQIEWIKNRVYFNGKRPPFASMLCTFFGWELIK